MAVLIGRLSGGWWPGALNHFRHREWWHRLVSSGRVHGADGRCVVMAAEALLENPALFNANRLPLVVSTELAVNAQADNAARIDQDALLMRYLELCDDHPPPASRCSKSM